MFLVIANKHGSLDIREANEDTKTNAGINGLEKAKRDIANFKTKLCRRLDAEHLIATLLFQPA